MAHVTTNDLPIRRPLGAFFLGFFEALARASEANARVAEFERLQSKSDTELAELGLRREDLARHVFRHVLYL